MSDINIRSADMERRFKVEADSSSVPEETGTNDQNKASNVLKEAQVKMLAEARKVYADFSVRFERTINAYFGTKGIVFTMKPGGWWIDLERLVVNADPNFFLEKGYSESEAIFATFHEAEHFRDMAIDPVAYRTFFKRIKAEYKTNPLYAKSLQRLYNCIDDVLVNNSVKSRWVTGQKVINGIYPKLFRTNDLRFNEAGRPVARHRQFMYALLREEMLPDEACIIDPEVRAAIDSVQRPKNGSTRLQAITRVKADGSAASPAQGRFKSIQGSFEPIFKRLYDDDQIDRKDQDGDDAGGPGGEDDPFEGAIVDPVDFDKAEDAVDKINKAMRDKKNNEFEKVFGISKEDYDAYQEDYTEVAKYIEELSKEFDAVIERHKERVRLLRRRVEEGIVYDPALLATAVAEIRAGNLNPIVMKDYLYKDIEIDLPTELEVTLVCDGSGSMTSVPAKVLMQRRLSVLVLEALNLFGVRISRAQKEGKNINIKIRTEARVFSDGDKIAKKLSETLTYEERVRVHKEVSLPIKNAAGEIVSGLPGGNNNEAATFDAIREEQFDEERINKLRKRKLKKIIIFLTDGQTDTGKVQEKMLQLGALAAPQDGDEKPTLIIAGIGFDNGVEAVQTYAPNGHYAKSLEEVPEIFRDFLKKILKDL